MREEGLSAQGARLLNRLRERCNAINEWKNRILWAVVDASFCNRTVFNILDRRIVLIGRTRKDIRLYGPVPPNAKSKKGSRGRKLSYGLLLPTPEELRQDAATPWEKCPIFAAGKRHELNYKTIAPVLWRSGAGMRPMRLIVIRPLRYRAHGHTLYRQPAYLLVSDVSVPVAEALQAHFYRWEIEADQKEEKDLLGVGQAQGRNSRGKPKGASSATAGKEVTGPGTTKLMEAVIERSNMLRALHPVESNKGAAGVDGMTVSELRAYLREQWSAIRGRLLSGSYEPSPVRRVEISKPEGKGVRKLGIPTR